MVGVSVIAKVQLRAVGAGNGVRNAAGLHVVDPSIAAVVKRGIGVQWSVCLTGLFDASDDDLVSLAQCYTRL